MRSMRRGTWCSPPHFFWLEENVVKADVGTVPTVFKDIITRMAKLTEEEIQAIREANDTHYVSTPGARNCVSHRLSVETLLSMVRQEITGNYSHMLGPVQFAEDSLWGFIREEVALQKEQLKNLHSKHEATVDTKRVLEMMAKSKGVMRSIKKIDNPRELAGLLEALIDASGVADKNAVLQTLTKVQGHEKKG